MLRNQLEFTSTGKSIVAILLDDKVASFSMKSGPLYTVILQIINPEVLWEEGILMRHKMFY